MAASRRTPGAPPQRDQSFAYPQALDAASGRAIWVLKVHTVQAQPGPEANVQEGCFSRMAPVTGRDGLEIENETGRRFLFDVKARSARALP